MQVEFGIAKLATGRRRSALEAAFDACVRQEFQDRMFDFDFDAAFAAAEIAAKRMHVGETRELADRQIAGIAVGRKAMIATRNVRHFDDLLLRVIDPWSE